MGAVVGDHQILGVQRARHAVEGGELLALPGRRTPIDPGRGRS